MANTLKDAQEQATARLSITGQAANARRDAELLLLHVTGLGKTDLLTHPEWPLSTAQLEAYFQAVERRAQAEPIQYIVGTQEFYGLSYLVTPDVLIPRPETEHLVEAAITVAKTQASTAAHSSYVPKILDIGTGSGAIAVSLAVQIPQAQVVATDISEAALAVAMKNAAGMGVSDRIRFVHCDLLPQDVSGQIGPFDIICSNPPYIAESEVLESQVAAYEPHTALFAGPTGLEIYQRLIPQAAVALRPGGALLLEFGYGQKLEIELLLQASTLEQIHFIHDLQAIPRIAVAYRPS